MSIGPDPASVAVPAERRRQATSLRLGAAAFLLLVLGTAVLTSYTELDLAWQQRLGGWNYVISLALFVSTVIPLRGWRPDPR